MFGGHVAPIPFSLFPPAAVLASFLVLDSMSKNSVGSYLAAKS